MLKDLILDSINLNRMDCAFVVKNLKTGEGISYNENRIVSSASLIKIAIMGEVYRQIKEGRLSLDQRIVVNEEVKVPYSILTLLETGNSYSLKDIITLMIIQSDNTATNILIDLAGIDNINSFIRDAGLGSTVLQRKMMDFEARMAGRDNYTTAFDMARLLELLYKGEAVDAKSSSAMLEIMKNQLDKGMMRLFIPDETVITHKTGELDGLDHDVGIVFTEKCDYIICVMVWNAETNNAARLAIAEISRVVYDCFVGLTGGEVNEIL
jgi:beta-lactamase class A